MPACQSNLIGNGNGGNQNSGANSNAGVGAAGTNDQRQQQQQHEAQQQATQQQQQQHLQQLHYQQQQQQQGATAGQAYSSQIITVNNLVSGYTTAAQNLSPTSPNESNMVQSVYSQGPTPTQSPVHSGVGGGGGSSAGGSASSAGGGGNSSSGGGGGNSQVVKRKRSVNPQGDENFIRALEAVRTGGIGFCKAARLYGVNNRTLWLEYKKRGYPVSRPSIKARVVKQEPNLSPSPTPSTNPGDDAPNESYDHLTAAAVAAAQTAALNMQMPPQADTPTPSLMCTPHHASAAAASTAGGTNTHPAIGVMSLFDARYMESPTTVHTMSRQRYIDATGAGASATASGAGTINVNPAAAMNLQSINFNSI